MPTFIRLTDYKDSDTKEQQFANPANRYTANQDDFSKIPGAPIAYWASTTEVGLFHKFPLLEQLGLVRQGASTSDNDRFLRCWYEVNKSKIGFNFLDIEDAKSSVYKWFPYNKGGEYRKWYGNQEHIINYENDAYELKQFQSTLNQGWTVRLKSREYYFKSSVSWPKVSSGSFSARYYPDGFIFDVAGCCYFPENDIDKKLAVAFLNSKVSSSLLKILSPTLNYEIEQIKKLPFAELKLNSDDNLEYLYSIAKEEWDSRETSWDFTQNELIRHRTDDGKIASAFSAYCDYWREKFHQLHANEEELNRLFIEIYGLQDELTPDVALEDITILKSESRIENGELVFNADEIARQFISYAVGCMFGRYTLDREGLVVANMGQEYPTDTLFAIDDDNIIPVLEEEVFADDIAARFERFVAVAFGEEKVAENLRWIEEALGMNIRKYFYGEFYKDHVKRYKKRPIYWLIQSPKKGFSALIYMHRYQSDTMARVQTMYLREYLTKLESLIEHYNTIAANPSSSAKEAKDAAKLATKLEGKHRDALDFDRGDMSRIAAEQIVIDLDDGVKVNYQKFKGVLPDIGLSKGED